MGGVRIFFFKNPSNLKKKFKKGGGGLTPKPLHEYAPGSKVRSDIDRSYDPQLFIATSKLCLHRNQQLIQY